MPKPRPGQRRERRLSDGEALELRCYGVLHEDGEWLRSHCFGRKTPTVWHTHCYACRALELARSRGGEGTVRIEEVRKWLWEVVHRCGGISAAARTLGVGNPTILRWLGRYKGYAVRRIHRKKAAHIFLTLRGLRDGSITPDTRVRRGGRRFVYGCTHCGCELEDTTPGCGACWERHYRKERRRVIALDAAAAAC